MLQQFEQQWRELLEKQQQQLEQQRQQRVQHLKQIELVVMQTLELVVQKCAEQWTQMQFQRQLLQQRPQAQPSQLSPMLPQGLGGDAALGTFGTPCTVAVLGVKAQAEQDKAAPQLVTGSSAGSLGDSSPSAAASSPFVAGQAGSSVDLTDSSSSRQAVVPAPQQAAGQLVLEQEAIFMEELAKGFSESNPTQVRAALTPVGLESAELLEVRSKAAAPETGQLITVPVSWLLRHKCFDPGGSLSTSTEHYNATARPATRFQAGDRVFVWVDPNERAASPAGSKLTPPYAGPYEVAGISPDATGTRDFYVLDHTHESRGRPIVRHISFLRRDTSGMSDLEAQIEARPVEEVQVRVVDHYDQAMGGQATADSPDGTYFRVTYAYPPLGKPWFNWNTKQPTGRYDHFYLIEDCQRYLRERCLKLDAVGHLVFRDDATDEQRRAHEAHERMIMNRIATRTTELDLLEAQTREVRPSRGDPQLLKHEVEALWARAAELEASEKTTRRPPPASAQPVRSALKGSAPEARRKVTHHVGIAAPGQANEGEPSSADGVPSTAAAPDAPAEAATDRPAPLYSRGMLLAKRSDGLWGIAAAPVWIDTGVATPGYFYHIAWQDATDRTKKSRVSREPEAALQPKDDAVPRRRRGSSA